MLAARQSCIPGRERSSDILVALPESQHAIAEQELAQLLLLPTSPQCGDELLQFFCLEAFSGFCDPSGTVQRTSRQECERITTVTCAAEFQLILLTLQSRGISVSCDSFPQNSSACNTGEFLHPMLVLSLLHDMHEPWHLFVYSKSLHDPNPRVYVCVT